MTVEHDVQFNYATPEHDFYSLSRGDIARVAYDDEAPEIYMLTAAPIPGGYHLSNLATGRYLSIEDAQKGPWRLLYRVEAGSARIIVEEK